MLLTGLRRGEAIGLQWGDLDLDRPTRSISSGRSALSTVNSSSGHRRAKPGSGPSSSTPPPPTGSTGCNAAPCCSTRGTAGSTWTTPSSSPTTSGPLHPAPCQPTLHHPVQAGRGPRIRLHDLRHTSASLGLAAGEPLLQVSRRLGHSSIAITADVYSQVLPEAAKEAATTLSTTITGT